MQQLLINTVRKTSFICFYCVCPIGEGNESHCKFVTVSFLVRYIHRANKAQLLIVATAGCITFFVITKRLLAFLIAADHSCCCCKHFDFI